MITNAQALRYKDSASEIIIKEKVNALTGITVDLDGDYVVHITVMDTPTNVEKLQILLSEFLPEAKFNIIFTNLVSL